MALTNETIPYEILVRFSDMDGSFQGAHVCNMSLIREDGVITHRTIMGAREITQAEVGGILGKENARLIEAIDAARADLAAVQGQVAALTAENEQLRAALSDAPPA